MANGDLDWMDQAECRNHPDLDWFDLDCYLHAVLAVCAICRVGDKCLDYAIEHELRDGVWGGEWGYRLEQAQRRGTRGQG